VVQQGQQLHADHGKTRELGEEEEELRQAADALQETEAQAERVANLRTCAKSCSAGDADGRRKVLASQERLVAAMLAQGPAAMGSTAAVADDMVELTMQLYQTADYPWALQMLERAKQELQPPTPPAEITLIFFRQVCVSRFDEALVQQEGTLKIRTRLFGAEDEDVSDWHFKSGVCSVTGRKETSKTPLFIP
jgi:hypothetical protein